MPTTAAPGPPAPERSAQRQESHRTVAVRTSYDVTQSGKEPSIPTRAYDQDARRCTATEATAESAEDEAATPLTIDLKGMSLGCESGGLNGAACRMPTAK